MGERFDRCLLEPGQPVRIDIPDLGRRALSFPFLQPSAGFSAAPWGREGQKAHRTWAMSSQLPVLKFPGVPMGTWVAGGYRHL